MADYRSAPEIRDVADEVIEEHHELLEQRGPRIEWIMTRPSSPSGKVPDFKIRKVTGVNAFLAGARSDDWLYQASPFVAVEVSSLFWAVLVNGGGERGFLDHVVSHLVYDYDKDAWVIEGPRFGEFEGVLERHGFWRPGKDYRRFAGVVAEQLSLLPDEPEEDLDDRDQDRENGDGENVPVSLTFGDTTVETDTDAMRHVSEGLADGSIKLGPNGEKVDADTGEVLEPAGARS